MYLVWVGTRVAIGFAVTVFRLHSLRCGALALCALLGTDHSVRGAEAAAAKGVAGGPEMQRLLEQVKSQRDRMISAHESLARELREAGEEQRKAILERMQEQKREFEAAQSALHKQIREEQRRQRQAVTGKR